jgi:hypothetical protein
VPEVLTDPSSPERGKGTTMPETVDVENIYALQRREGIDDIKLRKQIGELRVGDFVKLTFLIGTQMFAGETLLVQITSIGGQSFRGRLTHNPTFVGLVKLRIGARIAFTTEHIHSIRKEHPQRGS